MRYPWWLTVSAILSLTVAGTVAMVASRPSGVDRGIAEAWDFGSRGLFPASVEPGPFGVVDAIEVGDRIEASAAVVGLVVEGEARAYPAGLLTSAPSGVVNDELGGLPVVLAWCEHQRVGIAFDRRVGWRRLRFRDARQDAQGDPSLTDTDTGTRWSRHRGEAISGPLRDRRLTGLPTVVTDWNSWRSAYPETTALVLARPGRLGSGRRARGRPDDSFRQSPGALGGSGTTTRSRCCSSSADPASHTAVIH